MQKLILLLCVVISSVHASFFSLYNGSSGKNFIYNRYSYDVNITIVVNETTEQILDFYQEINQLGLSTYPTRVHVSTDDTITEEYPIFVTASQQKGVLSWEIPLVVRTKNAVMQFKDMARTLCPHDAGSNLTSQNPPTISVTTWNPNNVTVGIRLKRVQDFYVQVDKEILFSASPSTPKYYFFSFDQIPGNKSDPHHAVQRFNYTIPKSVLLVIESDDNICATVSIQNNSCPVFDNEKDMLYQGYHLTMSTKGGITLTQKMFPKGFYIVFIVKENDGDCMGETPSPAVGWRPTVDWDPAAADGRVKNFRLLIKPTVSYQEYLIGSLALTALVLVVPFFALIVYIPNCHAGRRPEDVLESEDTHVGLGSRPADTDPIINADGDSDSEPEVDVTEAMPPTLTLGVTYRGSHTASNRRSNRYFWSALTVAVVYSLPVVQLLYTYQQMVFSTGDQDLCYYNFLCAHPLGLLSDFNHVYSNIGYILLGLAFMLQVRRRQLANVGRPHNKGIPEHPGLFYSMGLALVMEGALSACYHLCPNKMNFQFDSSFMYVIAVLCMVKLYQNRHPDVNASAHSTFILLAFVMALGVYGIMFPSLAFWVLFTILHIYTFLVLSLKIYYVGKFKLDADLFRRAWVLCRSLRAAGPRALWPGYPPRAALLLIANLLNWALAGYGLYKHNKDFARHLLAILMGNTILYTLFYVIMKLIHREKILVYTWLYLLLAHVAWFLAGKFFLDSNTKWSETPAHSRQHNRECTVLNMYDSHDTWHVVSAAALYLSFNMLLTVDDALIDVNTHTLPIF